MRNSLTQKAQDIVVAYAVLPNISIPTPYYNNRIHGQRAAFRALIGKGTPQEISEEFSLMVLKERKKIELMSLEEKQKFAVDHQLGVDCSAFVFHVLDTECKEKNTRGLGSYIRFPRSWSIVRRLIARFRVAENTNVYVLSHDANSTPVLVKDIKPGDFISFLAAEREQRARDHIILIDSVSEHDDGTISLTFVHSIRQSEDGLYNHGIKRGEITVTNTSGLIQDQNWQEATYRESPTLRDRKDLIISLRRMKAFVS